MVTEVVTELVTEVVTEMVTEVVIEEALRWSLRMWSLRWSPVVGSRDSNREKHATADSGPAGVHGLKGTDLGTRDFIFYVIQS